MSTDKDFEKACEDTPGLFYFSEPSHFTKLLLTETTRFKDAERIAAGIGSMYSIRSNRVGNLRQGLAPQEMSGCNDHGRAFRNARR